MDLYSVCLSSRLQMRNNRGIGKRGQHTGIRNAVFFELSAFFLEVEFFNDKRFFCLFAQVDDLRSRISNTRPSLVLV